MVHCAGQLFAVILKWISSWARHRPVEPRTMIEKSDGEEKS